MTSPQHPVPPARRTVLLGGYGFALTGLVACSGEDPSPTSSSPSPSATPSAEATARPSSTGAPADPYTTTVATSVVDSLRVRAAPADPEVSGGAGAEQLVLDRADEVSGEVVLLVIEAGAAWLNVQLPVRPNGTTGWVRTEDVRLSRHRYAVEVFLGGHELVLTRGAREVLRTPAGVGRTDRPTPGGDYYIKELLSPPDPTGIYGPYAYGLSGFSTVLTEFRDGEGVIGIHGTDQPDLVGTDVSSGCIRLGNDVVTRLVEEIGLPLGTPVTIRA